jgi:hypothetical protein
VGNRTTTTAQAAAAGLLQQFSRTMNQTGACICLYLPILACTSHLVAASLRSGELGAGNWELGAGCLVAITSGNVQYYHHLPNSLYEYVLRRSGALNAIITAQRWQISVGIPCILHMVLL